MKIKALALAVADTIHQMGPTILRKVLSPISKTIVNKYCPKPTNPFATVRIFKPGRHINSVDQKIQTMPEEWRGHKQVDRIIVYHEAGRKHIEMYLVINGQAHNVGVKNLTEEMIANVKKNSDGHLTNKSKDYLIDIFRTEFKNRAWLAQTTDHKPSEARQQWFNSPDKPGSYYGAGPMREVILDSKVDLFKTGNSIEWRDWQLNPHEDAYVFCIMDRGPRRNNNIFSLGFKKIDAHSVEDKLHLKGFIGEEEFPKFHAHTKDGIITVKYDGASTYFRTGPEGTYFWSPRISKVTGERLNYNAKVGDLRHIKTRSKIHGMGELLYVDKKTGRVLKAHEVGGVLNSDKPVPEHLKPIIHIYRIDKVNRKKTTGETYAENLSRINKLVEQIDDDRIRAPEIVDPKDSLATAKMGEGLVGIPRGRSIFEGAKFKHRSETQDGIITKVDFRHGDKGGIEGVVWYKDDKTGLIHKTSSGFTHAQKIHMMENPSKYEGVVMVLAHYPGHAARAATFSRFHDSKGITPPSDWPEE